ncbi:MAG: helix-turn-helix domain-containing protein [Candidatus Kariarchaeaceae archaeon]
MSDNKLTEENKKKAIEALIALGMSTGEAKTYAELVLRGPSEASPLAKAAGIHQPKIYSLLQSLESQSFIISQKIVNKANRFEAVSYGQVIEKLKKNITVYLEEATSFLKIAQEQQRKKPSDDIFAAFFEGDEATQVGLTNLFEKLEDNILVLANTRDIPLLKKLLKKRPEIKIYSYVVEEEFFEKAPITELLRDEKFSKILQERPSLIFEDVDFEKRTAKSINILLPDLERIKRGTEAPFPEGFELAERALIHIKYPIAVLVYLGLILSSMDALEKYGLRRITL